MRIFNYSIKNIINQLKEKSMIYIVIFSQIIALILIFFIYGVFSSYNKAKEELTINSYIISAVFDEDFAPEVNDFKATFENILDKTQKRLDYFYLMGRCDDVMVNIHEEYSGGKFSISEKVFDNIKIVEGRMISNEDIENGEKVIVGENIGNEGEKFKLGNENYTIIGVSKKPFDTDTRQIEMSYTSCPGSLKIHNIIMNFSELPRQADYLVFRDELKEKFGDNVFVDEFQVKDAEQLTAMSSVMVFAIIIGIGIALDTSLLYAYIIRKRKNQMAVFALVGGRRVQLFLINEAEIIILSVINSLIGVAIFKGIFERIIKGMYDNVTDIFNIGLYMRISLIFIMCIIGITSFVTLVYSDSNITKMLRR